MNILWIPHISWRTPQRAKIFCEKLSERHEVHVTDMDTDFNTLKDFFSVRYLKNYFYRKAQDGKITVHHIPRISPALFSNKLRRINYGIFSKHVQRIIEEHDIDSVVGTFVCRPPKAKHLVLDLFDDNPAFWREFGKFKGYANEIEEIENEYIEKADEVVVVSSVLAEKIRRDVHLIPNGVDIKKYQNADGKKIRRKLKLERTVVGLVGNHDKYKELYKVVRTSEKLKDLTFLVVGKGSAIPTAKNYITRKNIRNFKFTGFIDSNEIPAYYSAIDIGLCPYLKTKGSDSRSPMKLLEYTAAGKPVVCTISEEVKRMDFTNVILVEDTSDSLAEGIKKAINTEVRIPEKIKDYDINKLVMEYEKVLEK